jgi:surfactin synthase thioesterase subunit
MDRIKVAHDTQATIGQVLRAPRDDLLLSRFRKANASAMNTWLGADHSRAAVNDAWLYCPAGRRPASARLFCFPHAGVGAAVFRQWPVGLPVELEVCGVQLPGRTSRLAEPAISSLPVLADAVAQAITPYLDIPFAFFGHSMGAVLAAEVTRTLAAGGLPLPRHLFVSGRRPPHVPDPESPLRGLSDPEFVAEINRRYGGIPPEILQNQDILAILLPSLRADIAALETHRPPPRERLGCPISALGGADDPLTPRAHLDAWRDETTGAFEVCIFPGGHFYLEAQRTAVLAKVSATLAPMMSATKYRQLAQ